MNFIAYENKDFLFFWKPHGIPSTFGKEKSFLDDIAANTPPSIDLPEDIKKHFDPSLKEANTKTAIRHQIQQFGPEQEYGLLNRLDNDTAGFLYFAKDLTIFDNYRQLQAQNKVEKHYIAQVQGQFSLSPLAGGTKGGLIDFPIMHRSLEKMIAIQSPKDLLKGRGKEHNVQTFIELLNYDKKSDISTLLVKIHKGIRHQIRVHLSSIGFPIIGDPLYGKSETGEVLHLWSVGFTIVK